MLVKLTSARCGHKFDAAGRFTGIFANASGDEVEMSDAEGKRYIDRGLGSEVKKQNNSK